MATLTIPKKITKGEELIVISRKEYEKLLFKKELDRDLEKALEEVKQGKLIGPFRSAKEALVSLKRSRPKRNATSLINL